MAGAVLAVLAMAGCHRDAIEDDRVAVRFDAGGGAWTRSEKVTVPNSLTVLDLWLVRASGDSIGVMTGVDVEKSGTAWTYGPKCYWPKADTRGDIHCNAVSPAKSTTGYDYTITGDAWAIPDLLYAHYVYDNDHTPDGSPYTPFNGYRAIPLTFQHMFSDIEFVAAAKTAEVEVSKLSLTGSLATSGTLSATAVSWKSTTGSRDFEYTFVAEDIANPFVPSEGPKPLTAKTGKSIFILPTVTDKKQLDGVATLTLSTTYSVSGVAHDPYTAVPVFTDFAFEAGHTYTVSVLLGDNATFKIIDSYAGQYRASEDFTVEFGAGQYYATAEFSLAALTAGQYKDIPGFTADGTSPGNYGVPVEFEKVAGTSGHYDATADASIGGTQPGDYSSTVPITPGAGSGEYGSTDGLTTGGSSAGSYTGL